MKLYFDTNVYAFIAERNEAELVSRWLYREDLVVTVSAAVITESARISNRIERHHRYQTIFRVAREYFHPPIAYLQAQEILAEIRRCRPQWLVPRPDTDASRHLLEEQRRVFWTRPRKDLDNDPAIAMKEWYAPFVEQMTTLAVTHEKQIRQYDLETKGTGIIEVKDPNFQKLIEKLPNEERWWRTDGMEIWYGALRGFPSLRDYRDWLKPYLLFDFPEKSDWAHFWLVDVAGNALPRNRLMSLVEYYQIKASISRGNPMDATHGTHLVDCDRLVTCDHDFFKTLTRVKGTMGIACGIPMLLENGTSTALDALKSVLERKNARDV